VKSLRGSQIFNRQTFKALRTSSQLNLLIYFIGRQVICGKCFKCLTIQYLLASPGRLCIFSYSSIDTGSSRQRRRHRRLAATGSRSGGGITAGGIILACSYLVTSTRYAGTASRTRIPTMTCQCPCCRLEIEAVLVVMPTCSRRH